MTIKVLVAEDERLAREELVYFIGLYEDLELGPVAEDGRQLLEILEVFTPDVVFLDIQMPLVTGMEIATKLSHPSRLDNRKSPLVVFTTAYDEYALAAFAIDAVDYLLKPYDASRFEATVARIRKRFVAQRDVKKLGKLLLDDGDKLVVITPHTIHYAIRAERHVEIYTPDGVHIFRGTLTDLEQRLDGWPFYRTHRSYLVNLNLVREITPWFNGAYTITLNDKNGTKIPVSRSSARDLFAQLTR